MKNALQAIAFIGSMVLFQKLMASYEMSDDDLKSTMALFAKGNGGYSAAKRLCDHYWYETDDSLRAAFWLRLCAGTGSSVACEELSNAVMSFQQGGIMEWLGRCRALRFSDFETSIGLPERMDRSFFECDGLLLQCSNLIRESEGDGGVRHVGYWIRRPQLTKCAQDGKPGIIAVSGPVEKTKKLLSDPLFLAWVDENRYFVVARRDQYEVASRANFEKGLPKVAERFNLEGPVNFIDLDTKFEFKKRDISQEARAAQ